MKKILVCAVLFTLAACAAQRPSPQMVALQQYAEAQLPLARDGTLKWSTYYSGLKDRYIDAQVPHESYQVANQLYLLAKQFEDGLISKEDFEQRRQSVRADYEAKRQQRQAISEQEQQQRNTALAIMIMQNRPPTPQLTLTPMTPLNVVSPHPVTPLTATAFRTENQQQVQTVTNQFGWSCEYNYAGRTFWRTFVGICPQSVQVQ